MLGLAQGGHRCVFASSVKHRTSKPEIRLEILRETGLEVFRLLKGVEPFLQLKSYMGNQCLKDESRSEMDEGDGENWGHSPIFSCLRP